MRSEPQDPGATSALDCHVVGLGWAVRLTVTGQLCDRTAPDFQAVFEKAVGGAPLLIVDLRRLRGLDATGARTLTEAATLAHERRVRTVLVRGNTPPSGFDALTDHPAVEIVFARA